MELLDKNYVDTDDIKTFDILSDDEIQDMDDKDFDEIMENDVLAFDNLSEEEIMRRQKEFATLSEEGKELLNQIKGIQNSRIITLNLLMYNSVAVIRDAEDDIDDIEFSESYLEFMNWYLDIYNSGKFYPRYSENEVVFENILNSGLEDEDENRIENDVGNRADENGRHAFVGVSFRAKLRSEAEA